MVTSSLGPGPGKIVGHEVEEVEVLLGCAEVDVLEGPSAGGKSSAEEVAVAWEVYPNCCEKGEEVPALFEVGRVFPVDWNRVQWRVCGVRMLTYCQYHQIQKLQQDL